MKIKYESGSLKAEDLTKLSMKELITLYNEMIDKGVSEGLDKYRYLNRGKFQSENDAALHCMNIHSTIVALYQGRKEEKEGPPPEKAPIIVNNVVTRKNVMSENTIIHLVHKGDNPKRGNSAARFAHYKTGMTVQEYINKVGDKTKAMADIRWDIGKGYITTSERKEAAA